jgi:rare lipoprotein A
VTNLDNRHSVIVKINDRGACIRGRIIDLSPRAADALAMKRAGVVAVFVEPWSINGCGCRRVSKPWYGSGAVGDLDVANEDRSVRVGTLILKNMSANVSNGKDSLDLDSRNDAQRGNFMCAFSGTLASWIGYGDRRSCAASGTR